MATVKFIRPISQFLTLTAGIALVGCGSGKSPVVPTTPETFNLKAHSVTFTVVDAKTDEVISHKQVIFGYGGPSDLSNASGTLSTSATVTRGGVSVYTDNTTNVFASATATGYLPASASVYASRANNVGVVKLLNLSALPGGVTSSKVGGVTRLDFDVATGLAFVPGSGIVSGTPDSVLVFQAVSAITGNLSNFSLPATGVDASVYYLAPAAAEWVAIGSKPVSSGQVTLASAVPGTWAVATAIPASTVTFSFSKSVGYDAVVSLSGEGWIRSFRTGGDTSVTVRGVPVGASVEVAAKFNGKQAYFNTHAFVENETFDLSYAISPAGTSQTFVAQCTDGTVPENLSTGFPVVVLKDDTETGFALVSSNPVTVRGLGAGLQTYIVPTLDKTWTFVPGPTSIKILIDCSKRIITGATGGSGT